MKFEGERVPAKTFAETTENAAEAAALNFGGQPPVTVRRQQTGDDLQMLSMTLLPGLGMNLWDATAYVPGYGVFRVLWSKPLPEAAAFLASDGDPHGTRTFKEGSALLAPFVNRIRGELSGDGRKLRTHVQGREFHLPANFAGALPTAETHSIHGFVFNRAFEGLNVAATDDGGLAAAILHGGDFDGCWPSKTDVAVRYSLDKGGIAMQLKVTNVGEEDMPVGLSWHPYFDLPSGDRSQVRVRIPAASYAEVDNYDNVFPSGRVLPVAGTRFDFNAPEGRALGDHFYDDNFLDLVRDAEGAVCSEIIDPAADYGVRVISADKQISAVQMYAPSGKNFVVIEQQFNLANPYGKEWNGRPTGMVVLAPGESVTYTQRVELFRPSLQAHDVRK
jgi:galactose mutarotase-like enzyme